MDEDGQAHPLTTPFSICYTAISTYIQYEYKRNKHIVDFLLPGKEQQPAGHGRVKDPTSHCSAWVDCMVATIRQHQGCLYPFTTCSPSKGSEIGGHSYLSSTETDFEDVQVGSPIPMLVKAPISHMQSVRYADASGDFNPLHTDLRLAK